MNGMNIDLIVCIIDDIWGYYVCSVLFLFESGQLIIEI